MIRQEVEDEVAPRNGRADWSRIAAWTFGSWALLVPIAAAIVIAGQNQQLENQERILTQMSQLRYEFLERNGVQDAQIAAITANQTAVLLWKARIEATGGHP